MHPIPFRMDHHLSDWPECSLELHCCIGGLLFPMRLMMAQQGDLTFADLLRRLRCRRCRQAPAPVYLCAGHREFNFGAPPDCAIELVPNDLTP